jgi:hypothetical protein
VASLTIQVNGRWLHVDTLFGDIEMSTVWPGGSDELSWAMGTTAPYPFFGAELVTACLGPVPVWAGQMLEPDPSQDRIVAQGAWHEGDGFAALDGSGNATAVPDTAIDQAIIRGLRWTRPTSVSNVAVDLDVSQGPVTLNELLDAWSEQSGLRWGVDPTRVVVTKADDTTPTYMTLPLDDGLGYARDTYASTLIGRYQTSTGYATATRTNAVAEAAHGHVESVIDLTPRGVLTSTKANTILDNLLALGRAVPQWTTGIDLTYGELLMYGGAPLALEAASAGHVLRVRSGFDLAWRLQSQLYLDIPIGRTQLSDGVLTLQPSDVAARSLTDVLTKALNKKKRRNG